MEEKDAIKRKIVIKKRLSPEEELIKRKREIINLDPYQASLWAIADFTPDYYDQLKDIPLNQKPEIFVHGKVCHQNRDVGFYSTESTGYRYSGQVAAAFSFEHAPLLEELMKKVNQVLKTNFNGVLVNKYNSGEDYIGAHSDSEAGLDKNNMTVASLCYSSRDEEGNYNGIRKFRLRHKASGLVMTSPILIDYLHQPNELLVMDGSAFQKRYTHEIPIEKKVKGTRISLTFRCHSY